MKISEFYEPGCREELNVSGLAELACGVFTEKEENTLATEPKLI